MKEGPPAPPAPSAPSAPAAKPDSWWHPHLQHVAEHALHSHVSLHVHHRTRAAHPDAVGVNPWKTLIVLCMGFFMVLLDTTIVSIAVPRIVDGLHSSLDQILWVLNAYVLVFAVLLLPAGRLGDIFGERTLFAAGVVVFTAASVICGFAQNTDQLIVGRVIQGVGGALLTPQTIAILIAVFPPERRGAAFGVWGAVAGAAAIIGPALGGAIVTYFSWPVVFFVNVPIGILTLAAMFAFVPNLRRTGQHSLDPVGIVLVGLGLFGVVFGLIEGPRYSWGAVAGPITIPEVVAVGVVLLAVFFVWESRHPQPLLPLRMFANRNFALMNWVGAVMEFAILGFFLPLTIYFQSVLGMPARDAGLSVSPLPLASMFLAPVAGILADRVGGKYILASGLTLFAAGTAWFAFSATTTSSGLSFAPPLVLAGIGMGCIFAPLGAMAMMDVPTELAGAASGLINTTRQLGAVVGGAVIGAVLQSTLSSSLREQAAAHLSQVPEVPADLRGRFLSSFANIGTTGVDVGPSQTQSAGVAGQGGGLSSVAAVVHDVFVGAFVSAMRPTILVAVGVVLAAAVSCLFIATSHRHPQPAE